MNEAKKILENNYIFSEILYIDTYEARKFKDKDKITGYKLAIPIPNIILLLSSITTIIDFIMKYLKKNKKGKIIIKKGDAEITIDGDYSKGELEEILAKFTEIATEKNIEEFIQIKRDVITKEVSYLDSRIEEYQKLYEIISKHNKESAENYIVRINYWNERKKFLLKLLDELNNVDIQRTRTS